MYTYMYIDLIFSADLINFNGISLSLNWILWDLIGVYEKSWDSWGKKDTMIYHGP